LSNWMLAAKASNARPVSDALWPCVVLQCRASTSPTLRHQTWSEHYSRVWCSVTSALVVSEASAVHVGC